MPSTTSQSINFHLQNINFILTKNSARFVLQGTKLETLRHMIIIYGMLSFHVLLFQYIHSNILTDSICFNAWIRI
jgi:hypothetical protein